MLLLVIATIKNKASKGWNKGLHYIMASATSPFFHFPFPYHAWSLRKSIHPSSTFHHLCHKRGLRRPETAHSAVGRWRLPLPVCRRHNRVEKGLLASLSFQITTHSIPAQPRVLPSHSRACNLASFPQKIQCTTSIHPGTRPIHSPGIRLQG